MSTTTGPHGELTVLRKLLFHPPRSSAALTLKLLSSDAEMMCVRQAQNSAVVTGPWCPCSSTRVH